jgi:hypothetical protein
MASISGKDGYFIFQSFLILLKDFPIAQLATDKE